MILFNLLFMDMLYLYLSLGMFTIVFWITKSFWTELWLTSCEESGLWSPEPEDDEKEINEELTITEQIKEAQLIALKNRIRFAENRENRAAQKHRKEFGR